MAEYKTTAQINYGWGLSLNMTGKAPAINKRIFATLADAQAYVDDAKDSAVAGLQLSVINDTDDKNGIYFVKKIGNGTESGILEKNNSVLKATTYTEAIKLATADRVGLITIVSKDEDDHKAGLYVVTAEGKIERLGTTESGDLDDRVAGLEKTVKKLDGEDTVDGSVKKQIKDTKEALEKKIEAAEKAHTVVSNKTDGHVKVATATDESTGKQTVTITENDIASQTALDALTEKVGNEASGDTTATGVFKYVDDKVANAPHPKYTVSYDATKGEYNLKMDNNAIEGSTAISFKDYMVRSGSVVKGAWNEDKTVFTENTEEITSGTSTAIKLVLNVREHGSEQDTDQVIYIDAETLVNVYTVDSGSTGYLAINGYKISLTASAIGNIEKIKTIESDVNTLKINVSGLTADALKEITINGHKINSGSTNADVNAVDVKTVSAITDGNITVVESGSSVESVLSGIYTRIKELDGSKVTSITAVDNSGVKVDNTDNNNPKVGLDFETPTDSTVNAGHIAIKVNADGQLYGEMYYLGDDTVDALIQESKA